MRGQLFAGAALAALTAVGATAQEAGPAPRPADLAADLAVVRSEDGLLTGDELDAMLAPVALFPDSLLTQILVAATVPLDVAKAGRWVSDNAQTPPADRAAAAEAEGWDDSVAALAAGFPIVIEHMADDLDGTEDLGDAVMAQTDDVLASVQRLRADAEANGFLASNEAQVVSDDGDAISIAPADPGRVYVPSYDPGVVYATAPAAAAPAYVTANQGTNWLTTGAIAFGSALLIDEIFDDDDDDWDNYWGGSHHHIDWDDGDLYARPDRDVDIDVGGDLNIGNGRNPDRADDLRDRLGGRDPDHPRRDHAWKPDPERQAAARDKLAERKRDGDGGDRLAALKERGGGDGALADRLRDGGGNGALAERVGGGGGGGGSDARAKIAAAAGERKAAGKTRPKPSALKPGSSGGAKLKAARERGVSSSNVSRGQIAAAKAKGVSRPAAARPVAKKPAVRKAAANHSAFRKPSGGGGRARAASARGHKSAGRKRR